MLNINSSHYLISSLLRVKKHKLQIINIIIGKQVKKGKVKLS